MPRSSSIIESQSTWSCRLYHVKPTTGIPSRRSMSTLCHIVQSHSHRVTSRAQRVRLGQHHRLAIPYKRPCATFAHPAPCASASARCCRPSPPPSRCGVIVHPHHAIFPRRPAVRHQPFVLRQRRPIVQKKVQHVPRHLVAVHKVERQKPPLILERHGACVSGHCSSVISPPRSGKTPPPAAALRSPRSPAASPYTGSSRCVPTPSHSVGTRSTRRRGPERRTHQRLIHRRIHAHPWISFANAPANSPNNSGQSGF